MTANETVQEFRVLPMGDAKARTNDDSGVITPEDEFVAYDSE